MDRRSFLKTGLAGILAAKVAPAFVGSSILMPVRQVWTPEEKKVTLDTIILTIPPALSIAKHGLEVFRWDEYGKIIADTMPWNEIDAKLKR